MTLPTIPALFFDDKKMNREKAIDILDGSFARLSNNLMSLGIAVGKAMAYWSLDIIKYDEYKYYVDALYSAYNN